MKELIILGLAYLAYTKFSESSPAAAPASNTQAPSNQTAYGEPNGGGYSAGGVGNPSGSLFDSLLGAGSQILRNPGGSIFDDLFGQASQSTPTYRDEYPVPPGVIHAGGDEPFYDEPVYGDGGGGNTDWSVDDPYGLIVPFYDY